MRLNAVCDGPMKDRGFGVLLLSTLAGACRHRTYIHTNGRGSKFTVIPHWVVLPMESGIHSY